MDTYQFKQSGLSVSLGGQAIDNIQGVYQPAKRASEVEDSRLKALYDYKAVKAVDNLSKGKNADGSDPKGGGLSVSVSLGTTKQQSETNAEAVTAAPSQVTAGGDVNITATGVKDKDGQVIDGGDLNIIGSTVDGKNIHLKAANDVNLIAADNTTQSETTNSGKSASIGVSLSQGQAPGFFLGGNKSKGNENGNTLTHTNTQITATDTLTIESGEDTNLKGAQVKGKTVNVKADGDLNLESLQDEDNYKETNKSAGATINFGVGGVSGTGSASKGKINSEYQSVTEQTGIYAGEGGFDITVGKNTDLKGAVIASDATPDKNKLSTGTLTYSDIQNKADYNAESSGYSVGTQKGSSGYSPGIPVSGNAGSTTQSAIAPGTIVVGGKAVTPESLRRDTTTALNELGKIFDKKTVQEKQELANLFSQEAVKLAGDIAEREKDRLTHKIATAKTDQEREAAKDEYKRWMEGGTNKVLLHTLVGGLTGVLANGDFMSGASGEGFNEVLQQVLKNIKDPTLHQFASILVGGAAAKVLGGDAKTGAITALNGTKYNFLSHWQKDQRDEAVLNEDWDKVAYWDLIDKAQDYACSSRYIDPKSIDWDAKESSLLLQEISLQAQDLAADPDFQNSWLVNRPTADFSTVVAASSAAIVVSGVTLYYYNGGWVKAAPIVGSGGLANASQYQRLKDSLAIEEIQSVVATTEHGAIRLMQRGFTPEEISTLKLSPDKIMRQGDGAQVFIKNIGDGKYNVIVEGENGVVTALKNIGEKSLERLSKNYVWE